MKGKNYKALLTSIKTFILDVDGVLTDGNILITGQGEFYRTMNTKDGYAIRSALKQGLKIAVISGSTDEGVRKRLKFLGIYDIYLGIGHKLDAYQDLLDSYALNPKEILYIGDDIPDIPVMKKVGVSCCPNDAVVDVKSEVDYISHKKGGEGCVREIIEQVLRVQGKWKPMMGISND